jgi:tight adherence protein B
VLTALAAVALAVLSWPSGEVRLRARLRRLAPREQAPDRSVRDRLSADGGALPLPAVLVVAATTAGAVLGTPLVAVLSGVLAGFAAHAWTRRSRQAAEAERLLALGRGLAALAADLRSGRSLGTATDAAAVSCGDEGTGRELLRALRAPEAVGPTVGPLARISGAVLLSTRTGCSLAEVVGAVEDDLRARHRAALELGAATAGPRAGALLLAGLPVLGLAMGSGVGADPWRVLTTTGTGQVLLVAGVALEIAGVAWTGRLVRRAIR